MKGLAPLERSLRRPLAVATARRLLAWAACTAVVLAVGAVVGQALGQGRVLQLGLLISLLSALPAFLFWPPSASILWSRLRYLDEGSTFEAYLEAPPGPTRRLLAPLAASAASALPFRKIPRERVLRGLGPLLLGAVFAVGAVEALSFAFRGQGLSLLPAASSPPSAAIRTESTDFSDFATEDPAARRLRRELALESEKSGTEAAGGASSAAGKGQAGQPGSRRPRSDGPEGGAEGATTGSDRAGSAGSAAGGLGAALGGFDQSARQKAAPAAQSTGSQAESGPGGGSAPPNSGRTTEEGPGGAPAETGGGAGKAAPSAFAGRSGQGFDKTGNTGIPSPLLDYQSRFAAVFAERTGTQITAGDRLDLAELRDFQRRYFGSFELATDLGVAEDPYTALLKRRWDEVRGGLQ